MVRTQKPLAWLCSPCTWGLTGQIYIHNQILKVFPMHVGINLVYVPAHYG